MVSLSTELSERKALRSLPWDFSLGSIAGMANSGSISSLQCCQRRWKITHRIKRLDDRLSCHYRYLDFAFKSTTPRNRQILQAAIRERLIGNLKKWNVWGVRGSGRGTTSQSNWVFVHAVAFITHSSSGCRRSNSGGGLMHQKKCSNRGDYSHI